MKLAILILGERNSGKTSIIKNVITLCNGKSLKIMKAGWNDIFLNTIYKSLRIHFFCVPASPSETNKKLSVRFASFVPDTLIVAEQLGGINYADTMSFLTTNGYIIYLTH